MLTQRFVGAVLIMCLLPACAGLERGRSAPQPTNARLETTSHSSFESASDYGALKSDSIVNAQDETGTGPKTDRAVGIVALVTVLATFTMILIGLYKLTQMF
jgi:hypothetical protein